jgi:hypothetical protein
MIAIYILYDYCIIGLCFAIFFVFSGAEKIHHPTKDGGIGLKILLLPASILLWPYLLKRVIQKK